ncbi:MAG: HD-GYP domain-containing protein [Spirochaetes bacterium]|nr:HD-GYP domain-containing protein [Spirochaetota bacterium]
MKKIPVSTLADGAYFDKPVFLDETFVLLAPDAPVTPELVRRLRKWKYDDVHCDGQTREVPGYLAVAGAEAAKLAPQTIDEDIRTDEQREAARTFCSESVAFVTGLFEVFAGEGTVNLGKATDWVKQAITAVRDNRDFVLRYAWAESESERWLTLHTMRATLLALMFGDFLKAPPVRLIELGNACLLHDIGMYKLPETLRRSKAALSPDERKAISAHTALGYRILKGFSAAENIALAALEHHERMDGSGYPRGLSGDQITEYARIIAVACSFEAMVSPRPFRVASFDMHTAIRELLQKNRKQYDDRVLKALVFTLSVYPIGTHVLLSNDGKGVVIRTDPARPRCPVVRVLADPAGKRPTKTLLLQSEEAGGVSVVRALTPAEVKELGRT